MNLKSGTFLWTLTHWIVYKEELGLSEFQLDKSEMIKYLKQINDDLKSANETGEILISGGASMCLVHEARPSTKDIDAIYEPKGRINEISEKIAKENNLEYGWLNDGVKGFLHPNMKSEIVYDFGNLKVSTVSAEALLAMKITALRSHTKDLEDAKFLMKKLNITNEDKLLKVLSENTYKERLTVITKYKALEVLQMVRDEILHNKPSLKD